MPQMYPMNWLFLFTIFTILFSTIIIMAYFSKKNFFKKKFDKFFKKKKFGFWKW
nr:TPA_asm: ATP synthase F0 subunit 8 [Neodiprion lecontei]